LSPVEPRGAKAPAKVSFLLIMAAVFWSFFGVRKSADHARIADSVKPQHYIVAGLLGAALLVFLLIGVVQLVLHFVHPA
jgi:amino acid transporter